MIVDRTIREISQGYQDKIWTVIDVVNECFEAIEKNNTKLNALITVIDKETVLKQAKILQNEIDSGHMRSPLHGIPYVMKDSYITQGIKTTAASKVLADYIPPNEGTVHQKLNLAGSVLIGKANMDAWGHGASNENSDFGPVKNPYDFTRAAGGSGGGPAAAVAAGMAVFGIGEDTGGSIRTPAAWCGISAMKVTYGRVSRYGCIAYASSFDTVGPTARTVEDCSIVLKEIAGQDPYDATSSHKPVDNYPLTLNEPVKGLTIGFPRELFNDQLDPEIKKSILQALEIFKKQGVTIVDLSMPMLSFGISIYYVIAPSETSSNLARYDGIRYGNDRTFFGQEAKRRIMIGTHSLSSGYYDAYYKKALKARTLLVKEYDQAFTKCNAIVMPVTPYHPTKIGSFVDDPIKNMLTDIYTVTQNPAGIPSVVFPVGFSTGNLPIGMQLTGPKFSEALLFNLGNIYQSQTSWLENKPTIK